MVSQVKCDYASGGFSIRFGQISEICSRHSKKSVGQPREKSSKDSLQGVVAKRRLVGQPNNQRLRICLIGFNCLLKKEKCQCGD